MNFRMYQLPLLREVRNLQRKRLPHGNNPPEVNEKEGRLFPQTRKIAITVVVLILRNKNT